MKQVLFVGAHPDDIEIGCGGTVHKHRSDWRSHAVVMCDRGLHGAHPDLAECCYTALARLSIPAGAVRIETLRASHLETARQRVYVTLREAWETLRPEKVFVPEPDDHQDHATVYREAVRVFQSTSLFTYHIPRSAMVGLQGYYERLTREDVEAKVAALSRYPMYAEAEGPIRRCFDRDAVLALLRTQGVYIGAEFAECFRVVRLVK